MFHQIGKIAILGALILVPLFSKACSAGNGVDDPITVDNLAAFGDVWYGLRVSGTTSDGTSISVQGQKLSGTNVVLGVTVGSSFVDLTPPSGTPQVDRVAVSAVSVYILGGSADDILPAHAPPTGTVTGTSRSYRLATTYFNHNDDINVRVTCTFTFFHGNSSTQVAFDEKVSFKAYNLMQSAGTDVDIEGDYNATIAGVSSSAVGHFLDYLTGANLKHDADPSTSSSAMNQSASSIVSKTVDSTVMLGVLHGSETVIGDSDLSGTFDHDDIIARVAAKTTPKIPGFNLVTFWACKTFSLGGGTSGWGGAYGISGSGRAFVGYPHSIYAICWTEEEWDEAENSGANDPYEAQIPFSSDVSDNVEIFLDHLSIGLTVGEARAIAHNQIPMVHMKIVLGVPSFTKVASLVDGDYLTRLRYVYLNSTERATMASQSRSFDIPLVKLPIQ